MQGVTCVGCASREEFLSAFGEQVELLARQEALQKELEAVGEDMEAMTRILDELDSLNSKVGTGTNRSYTHPTRDLHDSTIILRKLDSLEQQVPPQQPAVSIRQLRWEE